VGVAPEGRTETSGADPEKEDEETRDLQVETGCLKSSGLKITALHLKVCDIVNSKVNKVKVL
jgi:hypothetical protein